MQAERRSFLILICSSTGHGKSANVAQGRIGVEEAAELGRSMIIDRLTDGRGKGRPSEEADQLPAVRVACQPYTPFLSFT